MATPSTHADRERILISIETLKESLSIDYKELSEQQTESQREDLIKHITWLVNELGILLKQLRRSEAE
jgi:hypothetical protein